MGDITKYHIIIAKPLLRLSQKKDTTPFTLLLFISSGLLLTNVTLATTVPEPIAMHLERVSVRMHPLSVLLLIANVYLGDRSARAHRDTDISHL